MKRKPVKRKKKPNKGNNKHPRQQMTKTPPKKPINKTRFLMWSSAAVLVVAAITISLVFLLRGNDAEIPDHAVAWVNGNEISFLGASRELLTAEQNLMWDYFDMFPDDWEIDHNRLFRGGQTFGDAVREEAVRLAAFNAVVEDYARGLGVFISETERQMIEDMIDDFVVQWGQADLDEYMMMHGYRDRAHLASSFEFDELMNNLLFAIMDNPVEFARFEAYFPPDESDEAEARANELLERLYAGEDFDTLMFLYSEDPGLEWNPDGYTFPPGQMVSEFENATRELEIGEISGLVRSTHGFHIIQRVEPDPEEMWFEGDDWLGAKHILIGAPMPSVYDMLWEAMQVVFGAMVDEADIVLLPALNDISLEG